MSGAGALRIGVLGCGRWGPNHIRNFSSFEESTVVAAADPDPAKLQQVRRAHPGIRLTANPRELLRDRTIHAIVIATPTSTHAALVREALQAGKDVLCEKPLTDDLRSATALTALADRMQRILMVGHVFLYHAGIHALKQYLVRKTLGRIHYLNLTRLNRGPIRHDVSVIWDLASHDISILGYLLGFPDPKAITVSAGAFLQRNVEDVAFIGFRYPSGALANIHVSWCDPRRVREIVIVGDRRTAIWDGMASSDTIRLCEGRIDAEPRYRDYGEFQLIPRQGRVTIPYVQQREPLRAQAEHFLQCVRTRRRPMTDGRFAVDVIRLLEATERRIRAARNGSR
ncbi:MAG: Gfo/Idh/MocA family oxidoreductase [Candidatus Omnitrophica bacterium]|nr:Gfo/Idh/MocA family oxidoreductase [Candidatus Omnitrophota bacterium]